MSVGVRGWLRGFMFGLAVLAAPLACQAQRAETAPTIVDVTVAELPAEARETIALIHKGGPYPYAKDGAVFGNREGVLPHAKRGYYREYTVKTPGVRTRGARRIVAGTGGELYYSDDHYNHFRRVRE
ncbi:MAG TPA: ribonuclease domain-containing protein [Usitatibacter sp.]|nr:ribonuclease domain-containing protein [Usitatibacter sp.]